MAEFSNSNTVSVAAGENLPLTETAVKAPACIMHREGSGLVTLRGLTNQCKARFKVSFGGNIAVPTGGSRKLLQRFRGCVHRGAAWLLRDRGG